MTASVAFSFTLEGACPTTKARAGILRTAHGIARTPIFMPVATQAALRAHDISVPESIGFPILLANTYHLLLRPGPEVFKSYGGIHPFMNWPRSVLTDSGGFQLFSLSTHVQMQEEGATFRSYVDGRRILLSPEVSIAMQRAINSDVMMALDQCIPATSAKPEMEKAMHLTHRWAKRSLVARGDSRQALFGIVQGGCFLDLRKQSADFITSLPFDGFAIGGVAVGEEKSLRGDVVAFTAEQLPTSTTRYLMGVGTPIDLLEAVYRGVDMFDCIIPTALAEQGRAFTYGGKVNLGRGVYAGSKEPIDTSCTCHTCRRFTRGYLHHLVKCGENLAASLIGHHNLHFYFQLMADMRQHILEGSFESLYKQRRETLDLNDTPAHASPAKPRQPRSRKQIGDYELVEQGGFASVRQISSGEIMHSVSDPCSEAHTLYVEQSFLTERAVARPLVIWDVGLGASTNAMAAIRAYEMTASEKPVFPMHMVSFENDLDSLRLALKNPSRFPHVRHPAPHAINARGQWSSRHVKLTWDLSLGDFLALLADAPKPDIIFFDPFSYKTSPHLWTLDTFKRVFECCKPEGTSLFTYSASTAVRAGLLAAGFYVARGKATGPKVETTIALSALGEGSSNYPLLGRDWFARWERSGNKVPIGFPDSDSEALIKQIRAHPQFQGC